MSHSSASPRVGKTSAQNLRAVIVQVLADVQVGKSLSQRMPLALKQVKEHDIALFYELTLGTTRHWYALQAGLSHWLEKPLSDAKVSAAICLGLYQLLYTRIPAHAAIHETVEAVKQTGVAKASGLVNALLRRTLREQNTIAHIINAHSALPPWIEKQFKRDWPDHWQAIAEALRDTAPLCLRVNTRQISRADYMQRLADHDISAKISQVSAQAILLDQFVHIPRLPGYDEGWFSVQDEHAQLTTEVLGDVTGKTVLDAAAAPGGKAAHILELYDVQQLVALDIDASRLLRVSENLTRLKLLSAQVSITAADASTWQATEPYDVILLDAPCTATGVMRRHPDIRLLRKPTDVAQTVALQARLLTHLWSQLRVGGSLLYITCSLLKDENERQISQFLAATADAVEVPINAQWGQPCVVGRQCLPSIDGGDGFYFARLTKRSA